MFLPTGTAAYELRRCVRQASLGACWRHGGMAELHQSDEALTRVALKLPSLGW